MADLISAYKAFQASREGYQATANALRQSLVEIERVGIRPWKVRPAK